MLLWKMFTTFCKVKDYASRSNFSYSPCFTGWRTGKFWLLLSQVAVIWKDFCDIGLCWFFQCPLDREPTNEIEEACDCNEGQPGPPGPLGPPGPPGPRVNQDLHWSFLFNCIHPHLKWLFTAKVWSQQGLRGETGRDGPPGPDGKPVSKTTCIQDIMWTYVNYTLLKCVFS